MSANKGVCYEVAVSNRIYFKRGSICSLHHGMVSSFVGPVQSATSLSRSLTSFSCRLFKYCCISLLFISFFEKFGCWKAWPCFILPTSSYNPTNSRPRPLTHTIQTSDLMLWRKIFQFKKSFVSNRYIADTAGHGLHFIEFVLHFVRCNTVIMSSKQIINIIKLGS